MSTQDDEKLREALRGWEPVVDIRKCCPGIAGQHTDDCWTQRPFEFARVPPNRPAGYDDMSTDVVAKLDNWLKSHNEGAHEDYIDAAICDIDGVREELIELEEQYGAIIKCTCNETYCRGDFDIKGLIRSLVLTVEQLNLALDAKVRAS